MFNFTKQLHSMMPIDARTAATTETPMQAASKGVARILLDTPLDAV
jgi:hypothetical protein